MKTEDKFHKEIERILKQIYYNPLKGVEHIAKRAIITAEYRYIEYLETHKLIKRMDRLTSGNSFGVQLENKGYEVFESYSGWFDYKKKVLDKSEKINKAKGLASRFWWIPILVSIISLIISLFALFL